MRARSPYATARPPSADDYAAPRTVLAERLPIVTYTNLFVASPRTVWMSPQVARVTGYRPEDWTARPDFFESVVHPDDRESVLADARRVREDLLPFSRDYRVFRRDGNVMWIHDESVPVLDANDEPELIQGYFVDITAQKQLEQELLHVQKDEVLCRLAGEVAHDFNNYLTAILGHVRLLEQAVPRGSPAARHSVQIGAAVDRARALTQRLLAYGHREVAQTQEVDIRELLGELEEILVRVAGEGAELVLDLRPTRHVRVDAAQLEQVVVNLVANARDAMPDGGTISVSTGTTGGLTVIEVADSGAGIEPAVGTRLFEPFFTTKGRGRGTGLGLAIVAAFVRAAGGTIDVDSAPGEGARFRILLPALRYDAIADASSPGS